MGGRGETALTKSRCSKGNCCPAAGSKAREEVVALVVEARPVLCVVVLIVIEIGRVCR